MTKKASTELAVVPPGVVGIAKALQTLALPPPRVPSALEVAHNSIAYLRTILDTAERAKALGWNDVFAYCSERARELVASPHEDAEVRTR